MLKLSTSPRSTIKKEIMPISPEKSKAILVEANKKNDVQIREILLQIAIVPYQLPDDFDQKFLTLQRAYQACKETESVEPILLDALNKYINSEGLAFFKDYIRKIKIEKKLQITLLTFIGDYLKLDLSEAYVELTVKQGKIYWRIMKNNAISYIRDSWDSDTIFTRNTKVTRLTWEQFRKFKDAGKRSGTVEITKKRFSNHFVDKIKNDRAKKRKIKQQTEEIWEILKDGHILNKNNRLSHAWRTTSGQSISFESDEFKGEFAFSKIKDAFISITSNDAFQEDLTEYYPEAFIYRPERSPKRWTSEGNVTNLQPASDENAVRLWDVSTHKDLTAHAPKEDDLEHDHIPSVSALKSHMKAWKNEAQSDEEKYEGENDKLVELANAEKADNWWTIAISGQLHKQGPTHKKNGSAQKTLVTKPFYDEISFYLALLEKELSNEEYLKALGAFRYLYRCQVKKPIEVVNGKYDRSLVAWHFFNDKNRRKDIDVLFNEKLISFQLRG